MLRPQPCGGWRLAIVVAIGLFLATSETARAAGLAEVAASVQPKVVKIYGAGGFRGLESYQSGFLISPDGYILTVWSYVLDTDYITVVLDDGRKYEEVKLVGADPRLELAILKIGAEDLPYFDLETAVVAEPGARVLAFSNLYGVATGNEPVSMQHGVVATKTRLEARRGVFETAYRGEVYVLDAVTNNPGAAGGVLTGRRGELLGMLGKELKNSLSNTWLNYAVPIGQLKKTIDDILSGKFIPPPSDTPELKPQFAYSAEVLGLVLMPDIVERTPPFVDEVRKNTPAAAAGIRADDLILFVNGRIVQSCKMLRSELERIDRAESVKLIVIRGQELFEVELSAPLGQPPAPK